MIEMTNYRKTQNTNKFWKTLLWQTYHGLASSQPPDPDSHSLGKILDMARTCLRTDWLHWKQQWLHPVCKISHIMLMAGADTGTINIHYNADKLEVLVHIISIMLYFTLMLLANTDTDHMTLLYMLILLTDINSLNNMHWILICEIKKKGWLIKW